MVLAVLGLWFGYRVHPTTCTHADSRDRSPRVWWPSVARCTQNADVNGRSPMRTGDGAKRRVTRRPAKCPPASIGVTSVSGSCSGWSLCKRAMASASLAATVSVMSMRRTPRPRRRLTAAWTNSPWVVAITATTNERRAARQACRRARGIYRSAISDCATTAAAERRRRRGTPGTAPPIKLRFEDPPRIAEPLRRERGQHGSPPVVDGLLAQQCAHLTGQAIDHDNSSSVRPDTTDSGSLRTGLRRASAYSSDFLTSSQVSPLPPRMRVSA